MACCFRPWKGPRDEADATSHQEIVSAPHKPPTSSFASPPPRDDGFASKAPQASVASLGAASNHYDQAPLAWTYAWQDLRVALLSTTGTPLEKIAACATAISSALHDEASIVSVLGVAPGGCKCVVLGSDGRTAPALPLGLLLPQLLGGGPVIELELPEVAPVADGAASGAQQGLPTEWRRALVDLQLMLACDSERRKNLRVLLLPLIFGSRRAGWLLLALPRTWSPPYPAADAGAAGATAVDAALWSLASCVAECCLGPVMARVDQMCDAVEAASSADSLQELVSSVVTAVSATLTYELHVDLGVRLALLPCKESPTGVLFYSTAPAAAGCAGEAASGAVPQSPMGKLGGRAPPTASVSMTNLAMRQQLVPPGHQPSLHSHFDPGPMVVAESAAAAAALLPATSMPTDFVRTSAPGTSGAPALAAPAGAGDVIPSKGHAQVGSGITGDAAYPDMSQSALLAQSQLPHGRSQQQDGPSRILQISRSDRRHAATASGMATHSPHGTGAAQSVVLPTDVEHAVALLGTTGAGARMTASGVAAVTPRGSVAHATMPAAFMTPGHALGAAAAGAVITSATAPSAARLQASCGIAVGRNSRMLYRRAITSGFALSPGGGVVATQPLWKAGPFNTNSTLLASLLDGAHGSRRGRPPGGGTGGSAVGSAISPATTGTGMLGHTHSVLNVLSQPMANVNSSSGFVATALAAAFGLSPPAGAASEHDKSGGIGPVRRGGGMGSMDAAAGFVTPTSAAVAAAAAAAQVDIRSGGSGNGAVASHVRLQASVVPDVPSYLQNTSRPTADVFNVVRRTGIAGGLASLIAIVAASTPSISAAAMMGPDAAKGAQAASGAGMAGTPRRSIRRNASASNVLYAASASIPASVGPVDASQQATVGAQPRGSKLLGQTASASGPALCVYIYSHLPLPASLLHVAKDRAMSLLRVLAPEVLRALTAGGLLGDEWAFLASRAQTVLGNPGQASGPAVGTPTAPPRDSSTSIPPPPLAPSPPPTMPPGLAGANYTCPAMPFVAACDSSVGGARAPPVSASSPRARLAPAGFPVFSHVNGGAPGVRSSSPGSATIARTRLRTGTGPNHDPRQQQQYTSPFVTGSMLAATAVVPHDPLDCPDAPAATSATAGTPDSALAAACSAAGNNTLIELLDMCGDGSVPGVSLGGLRTQQGSVHSIAHGAASRSITGNGFVSGLGYGGTGGVPGLNSTTLLTDTITDLGGAVTRQTQMATLVTAFTTTLARARKDNEQEGGMHAEDDIRALKIVRAIGQGGCSVVMLGRLHAMPVAVKVILPVGGDEDEQLQSGPGGRGGGNPTLQALWPADDRADGNIKGGGGELLLLPNGEDDAPGYQVRFGGGMGAAAADEQSLSEDDLSKRKRRRTTVRRRSQLAAMMRGARELAVLTTVSHPNIVQVYSYCTRVIVNDTAGGGLPQLEVVPEGEPLTSPLCTALIMEYCDMGSLADAIDCGAFAKAARAAARASGGSSSSRVSDLHQSASGLLPRRMDVAATAGTPAMRAVYLTLLEVALALRHLHSMNLVHCDVKPANVLLRSSATDPRGFTAKLTDFGFVDLIRRQGVDGGGCQVLCADDDEEEHAAGENKTPAKPMGTVTHMSPELLTGAPVDSSDDVYAFGILMWEIFTGKAPYAQYADNDFLEVPAKVVKEGLRPRFPSDTPLHFNTLAQECWSAQPGRRPTAPALVTRLQSLLDASCS